METALDSDAIVIHPELGNNLFWTRTVNQGDVEKAFKEADAVVETTLDFARHTGVTLESRGIVADWNKALFQSATIPLDSNVTPVCLAKSSVVSTTASASLNAFSTSP